MEQLKVWVFSVCVAGIAGTVAQMLIPKGQMEKVILVAVRVFFLSVLLSPVVLRWDFGEISAGNFSAQQQAYEEAFREETLKMMCESVKTQTQTRIQAALSEIGVSPQRVEVTVKEDTAEVTEVKITLSKEWKNRETDVRYALRAAGESRAQIEYTEES